MKKPEIKSYWISIDNITSLPIIAIDPIGPVGSCIVHVTDYSAVMMDLFVRESERHKGTASRILQHAIEQINPPNNPSNVESLSAYVRKNNIGSMMFFHANGFFISDENESSHIMTKDIRPE